MTASQPSSSKFTGIRFDTDINKEYLVHENLSQEIIIIFDDKMRLYLHDYRQVLKTQYDWLVPFGILITLIATLTTADFKDAFGISASAWKGLFNLSMIGCIVWQVVVLIRLFQYRRKADIEYFIRILKNRA